MISPAAEAPPNSGSISPGRPTRGPACAASHSRCAVTPSGTLRAPRRGACAPSLQDRVTLRQVNRLMRCGTGLRAAIGAAAGGVSAARPRVRAGPVAECDRDTESTGAQGERPTGTGASRGSARRARGAGRSFLSVLRPLRRVVRPRRGRAAGVRLRGPSDGRGSSGRRSGGGCARGSRGKAQRRTARSRRRGRLRPRSRPSDDA